MSRWCVYKVGAKLNGGERLDGDEDLGVCVQGWVI